MESIIIEIILGSMGEHVDFMLPAHVPLCSLMDDIARLIEQMNQLIMFDKDNLTLIDTNNGQVLRPEWTLAQNGIRDGSTLMIL